MLQGSNPGIPVKTDNQHVILNTINQKDTNDITNVLNFEKCNIMDRTFMNSNYVNSISNENDYCVGGVHVPNSLFYYHYYMAPGANITPRAMPCIMVIMSLYCFMINKVSIPTLRSCMMRLIMMD